MAPALFTARCALALLALLLAAAGAEASNYLALTDGSSGGATLVQLDASTGDLTPITLTQPLGTITAMGLVDQDTLLAWDSGKLPGSTPNCQDGQPNPGPDRPTSIAQVDIVQSQGNLVGLVTFVYQSTYRCNFGIDESHRIFTFNVQDNGDVLFLENQKDSDDNFLKRYDASTGQSPNEDVIEVYQFPEAIEPDMNMVMLQGGSVIRLTLFANQEVTLFSGATTGFSGFRQGRVEMDGHKLLVIESTRGTPTGALWEFDLSALTYRSVSLDESTGPGSDYLENTYVVVDEMGQHVLVTEEQISGVKRTKLRTVDLATGQIQLIHDLDPNPSTVTAAALTTVPEPVSSVAASAAVAVLMWMARSSRRALRN